MEVFKVPPSHSLPWPHVSMVRFYLWAGSQWNGWMSDDEFVKWGAELDIGGVSDGTRQAHGCWMTSPFTIFYIPHLQGDDHPISDPVFASLDAWGSCSAGMLPSTWVSSMIPLRSHSILSHFARAVSTREDGVICTFLGNIIELIAQDCFQCVSLLGCSTFACWVLLCWWHIWQFVMLLIDLVWNI